MKNAGMFSTLFIDSLRGKVSVDDAASGRMATLAHSLKAYSMAGSGDLWEAFLKQAVSYLEFVPPAKEQEPGVYPLYEDWGYRDCVAVLIAVPGDEPLDCTEVGRFYPGMLIREVRERSLNWGILTSGRLWRLYSTKSSRPFEDYVELDLETALEEGNEGEYALFERFFHKDSFVASDEGDKELPSCRLDEDRRESEAVLDELVKKPFLAQVDEVLQYICNGFIFDTRRTGEEYSEEERKEIFESAVKLIYRSLFLFYADARRLLPSDPEKADLYRRHSINAFCEEARKFRWGERHDTDEYDLWQHLKGLIAAVNDGDPEYGIMGYNGGLFDDEEERFLRDHRLRNDFLARALYLLSYVEPYDNDKDREYAIPYEDLEVRHLGELYENILECTVVLADADRIRRRTKKGVEIVLASGQGKRPGETFIKKGEVYFGESALARKQTGSYYTPESLVRFLNEKSITVPLFERFEAGYRERFDAFKLEALEGFDPGARRGAAESAAELVSRFAEDELLTYTVCDPAMGSGHFLVDAANQMTGVVMSLLAEVPHVEDMASAISNSPNVWRRRVTRRCIYGVDLNPLAVNLAKLSLSLNCFASEHKLTFLDHHLRCGNSLIGILDVKELRRIPERKKDKQQDQGSTLFDVDDLSAALTGAAGEIAGIARMDEDDTDRQRAALHEAEERLVRTRPIADLYTAYLMNPGIPSDEYRQLFTALGAGEKVSSSFNLGLPQTYQEVQELTHRHDYFHWPLEFPDVFGPEGPGGFNATVGNPPWDTVLPNSQEFFSSYDPQFRQLTKSRAKKASAELLSKNPDVERKWNEYLQRTSEATVYYKEPLNYSSIGKIHVNTYRIFLERFFELLVGGAHLGIIVPSGIYTDQGCQPLREFFFDKSDVQFLYCFENRRAIFNIHRSFKFVLFGVRKGGATNRFRCAFMEHDPERLSMIDRRALQMNLHQVQEFSPDTLSIMEFVNQREMDTCSTIFSDTIKLGSFLSDRQTAFQDEFNITHDARLLRPIAERDEAADIPLFEGKNIWILSDRFTEPTNCICSKYVSLKATTSSTRVVYRDITANTNERTFIVTVIPKGIPTGNTLGVCPMPDRLALLIAAICGSFVADWVMRKKITSHASKFIVNQLPLPNLELSTDRATRLHEILLSRASCLTCISDSFISIWETCFSPKWTSPGNWYGPDEDASYGPIHEQQVRNSIQDEAVNFGARWRLSYAADERLHDGRDTGRRAQLRADIDASVAHLYGLPRGDFDYILDTFPVLKNKEMKAFGEFMSKRKCLEEYDRIGRVLRNG
jgi:hypothetical protein